MAGRADNASLVGFDALLSRAEWFSPVRAAGRLEAGDLTRRMLTIPQRDAQQILRQVVRLVADLPIGATPVVVWQQDGSELRVDTASVGLSCLEGLVTITVTVDCDQLDGPAPIGVPFGVGTAKAPAGLVMSTLGEVAGLPIIASRWSDPITAFAWESLVELAVRVCSGLGRDASGRPLIPGSIGASRGSLLIQPMARNDLSALGRSGP